jgi:hypothetical protein
MRPVSAKWSVRRRGDMWTGTITVSAGELPISIGADGLTPRQALARAAIVMEQIAQSPIAAAVLPPGTEVAIMAIKRLAKAKNIRGALRNIGGKGARRLVRALGF